jgi:hypothetical protein
MNRIEVPFNKRIVLVGGDYENKDSIKSAMKNFRFSPDPGELAKEYRKMLQLSRHTGFGCINYDSIKIKPEYEYIWEANWLAGGSLDPRLYTEIIDGYYVRGGRMTTMYINTEYYAFMLGTGEWLFDSVDLFGTEEEYNYLQSHSTYKQISDIFMDRLHKAYDSITAMDYTELDDILL